MDKLSVFERDVLRLRFLENRSFKEIAATLGIGQRSMYSTVDRIKKTLRAQFSHIGIEPAFIVEAAAARLPELDLDEILSAPGSLASAA